MKYRQFLSQSLRLFRGQRRYIAVQRDRIGLPQWLSLDAPTLEKHTELIQSHLHARGVGVDVEQDVKLIVELKKQKIELLRAANDYRHKRKLKSNEIGGYMKANEQEKIEELKKEVEVMKQAIVDLDEHVSRIDSEIETVLLTFPNLLDDRVPNGPNEESNEFVSEWGSDRRKLTADPSDSFAWHDDIATSLGGLDLEAAARLAGARFSVLKGPLARLERALIQYFLDFHTLGNNESTYTEVSVPFIVSRSTLIGTGQIPKFEHDLFQLNHKVHNEDAFLIPTAEVPMTSLYRDQIVPREVFPLRFACHSPCFRAEAGAHGRDTRGLLRQHQFHKVELVRICLPEDSDKEYDALCRDSERLLRSLGLPYRRMLLCSGDTGFGAAITYDLEVWMPSVQKYREVASCSNCWDFQARRMNMRYKLTGDERTQSASGRGTAFPHTMNGSGLAVGRILAAILENCHNPENGTVDIPEVILPYMGGVTQLKPIDR